jgi:hypothetical protein
VGGSIPRDARTHAMWSVLNTRPNAQSNYAERSIGLKKYIGRTTGSVSARFVPWTIYANSHRHLA